MTNIGYRRVSSIDQNPDRQLADMNFTADDEGTTLYTDKVSGKSLDRPKLKLCLNYLRKDDVLHCHSMCRLARDLKSLQEIVSDLTAQGIKVHFHKESLIFTGEDDAMSTLMLQIMGSVAQFERSLIKERQREGIKKAKELGKHLGRKPKLSLNQQREVVALADAGEQKKDLAERFGVSRVTIYKTLKDFKTGEISGPVETQLSLPVLA